MPKYHTSQRAQFIFQPHRSVCTDAAVRPTLALSCRLPFSSFLTLNNIATLKSGLEAT